MPIFLNVLVKVILIVIGGYLICCGANNVYANIGPALTGLGVCEIIIGLFNIMIQGALLINMFLE